MVDTRRYFCTIEVLDAGWQLRVQPGAVTRQVNTRLARFGRKLDPDPASEIGCTSGVVVASKSSGMACGTQQNNYQTLESMVVVLPSGSLIDTSADNADNILRILEPALDAGLGRLRDRVRANPESVSTIRRLFAMKHTMV